MKYIHLQCGNTSINRKLRNAKIGYYYSTDDHFCGRIVFEVLSAKKEDLQYKHIETQNN